MQSEPSLVANALAAAALARSVATDSTDVMTAAASGPRTERLWTDVAMMLHHGRSSTCGSRVRFPADQFLR